MLRCGRRRGKYPLRIIAYRVDIIEQIFYFVKWGNDGDPKITIFPGTLLLCTDKSHPGCPNPAKKSRVFEL
jgi:hypothetical protein